ncbi:nitrate ABC transporter ATP-binding protein [Thermus scotoductus]|uniref:Nitrate ABC transporter ATP-binding protein n=1 Tax=Thermus scotoductus TaxID=37636 RepID=A0A430S2D8_THESC|nr:nitrate ABC transporter ATP-binding protein [Thermus scotoductus]RTH27813.1 nitrate ABC transporter ATP-binding protein [Thermus scotoductus]
MPIIECRGLTKLYTPDTGAPPVKALEEVDLCVEEGEFVAIVGPSGCGKSTLLEIIAGLQKPTSGEVLVAGKPVRGPCAEVGIVFQGDSTFPWLNTLENIKFGMKAKGLPAKEQEERARQAVKLVGLEGFEHHFPRELSGGMRQRVAIARTLVLRPKIILMDEPFGALDALTRLFLGDELLRIWQETQATILFVTHDLLEALRLADRVVVMSSRPGRVKRVVSTGLPRPRDQKVMSSPRMAELANVLWEELKREVREV